jgi:hypothetical protein
MISSRLQSTSQQRTTEEVFYDHLEKRKKGLVEEDIAENYSPEVVQLTCMGTYHGHEGVREGDRILKESLPNGRFEYYNILCDGGLVFLEWRAFSDGREVNQGADSFIIRDGRIVAQTIHYKVAKAPRRNKLYKVLLLAAAVSALAMLGLTQKTE